MTTAPSLSRPVSPGDNRPSTVAQLAQVPEEDIGCRSRKAPRTRRAYRLDVRHFMRTLRIASIEELRLADHKAVIAWERYMRLSTRRKWRRTKAHARPSSMTEQRNA